MFDFGGSRSEIVHNLEGCCLLFIQNNLAVIVVDHIVSSFAQSREVFISQMCGTTERQQ